MCAEPFVCLRMCAAPVTWPVFEIALMRRRRRVTGMFQSPNHFQSLFLNFFCASPATLTWWLRMAKFCIRNFTPPASCSTHKNLFCTFPFQFQSSYHLELPRANQPTPIAQDCSFSKSCTNTTFSLLHPPSCALLWGGSNPPPPPPMRLPWTVSITRLFFEAFTSSSRVQVSPKPITPSQG